MFIYELRFIFDFLQNFVGMTVQITFTFNFSRRLNIDFIFGVGWCFTFITDCNVTCESVWGSLIPTILPKLVVKTDCDQTILWKDFLERLTPPIWCSFCFLNKFKWKNLLRLFRWSESIIVLNSKDLILNRFVLLDFLTLLLHSDYLNNKSTTLKEENNFHRKSRPMKLKSMKLTRVWLPKICNLRWKWKWDEK